MADTGERDVRLNGREVPRKRMDRFHAEALGLMAELERVTRNRDMWKGQVERQGGRIAYFRGVLADIGVYGCGMLNQPAALNGPEESWLRARLDEYERRARAALDLAEVPHQENTP